MAALGVGNDLATKQTMPLHSWGLGLEGRVGLGPRRSRSKGIRWTRGPEGRCPNRGEDGEDVRNSERAFGPPKSDPQLGQKGEKHV